MVIVVAAMDVLLVEDDPRIARVVERALTDVGHRVEVAHDGLAGLTSAERGNHDLVVLDVMLPEMDGIDTIKEIRKIPAYKHVPIIAVTAKAMKGDREKCMEAGAWDYLSKPVDAELMVGVLRAWLG